MLPETLAPAPASADVPRRRRRFARFFSVAALAVALTSTGVAIAPAHADEIGQAPTSSNITGNGSFSLSPDRISALVCGFGGGTVYYPTTTGRYPVVAISPGFTASWSSISWLGPRLASWGFVVVGIETNSRWTSPPAGAAADRRAELGGELRPDRGARSASTAPTAASPATRWAAAAPSRRSPPTPPASSRPACRWRPGTPTRPGTTSTSRC